MSRKKNFTPTLIFGVIIAALVIFSLYDFKKAKQEKGLGDRKSLPTDEGMLFSFPGSARSCFWMKDMHFSLDMLWLNSARQVVYIQPDASPDTYPQTFCPSEPAQYVVARDSPTEDSVEVPWADSPV